MIALASVNEVSQGLSHRLELGDFFVNGGQMLLSDSLDLCAFPRLIFIEIKQRAAVFDREPERPGATEKCELVDVAVAKGAIAVVAAQRPDKADVFVVADCLAGKPARSDTSPMFTPVSYSAGCVANFVSASWGGSCSDIVALIRRSCSALVRTDTEDSAMAPAANTGDRSNPKAG